jgi:hypothetical protein
MMLHKFSAALVLTCLAFIVYATSHRLLFDAVYQPMTPHRLSLSNAWAPLRHSGFFSRLPIRKIDHS